MATTPNARPAGPATLNRAPGSALPYLSTPSYAGSTTIRAGNLTPGQFAGFLAGAVLTMTAGSVVLVAGTHPSPWAWYVVGAAALATALRARAERPFTSRFSQTSPIPPA